MSPSHVIGLLLAELCAPPGCTIATACGSVCVCTTEVSERAPIARLSLALVVIAAALPGLPVRLLVVLVCQRYPHSACTLCIRKVQSRPMATLQPAGNPLRTVPWYCPAQAALITQTHTHTHSPRRSTHIHAAHTQQGQHNELYTRTVHTT